MNYRFDVEGYTPLSGFVRVAPTVTSRGEPRFHPEIIFVDQRIAYSGDYPLSGTYRRTIEEAREDILTWAKSNDIQLEKVD